MPDMKNVIYDIERCICHVPDACRDCSHYGHGEAIGCMEELLTDALAILKEDCHNFKLECLLQKYDQLKEKYDALLKEQEAEWIYGEDETGVDGWRCSECNFFEPWFYEFDDDIDFIKRYEHCPKCGRRMISYTGKQEGR